MFIALVLFVILLALSNAAWRGTLLCWFVGLYGMGRAATDIFRGDVDRYTYIGPVTVTQLLCITAAIVGVAGSVLIRHLRHAETGNDP